ncbi:MAG: tripartite tricarboxylate transporter family receptor [Hyphomicrobiales bacterium]|nr:tripartite tricarboxylate transporter family receptor [Hyphomicrobiales bacterium]
MGHMWIDRTGAAAAGLAAALLLAPPTAAQSNEIEDFYKGRNIVLLVPAGAGGNLDFSSRLLGRYMSKYLPGSPNIVVQNMPGGGGMTMSNYLFNVSPKDGSAFGLVYQTAGIDQTLGTQARYKFGDFSWIGRISSSTSLVVLHKTAPVKTLADMKTTEVLFGSPGKSSQSTFVPTLMRTVLGYKTRVIYGYKGAAEMFLAMERGEIQARTGSLDSIMATQPTWLKNGDAFALAELSLEKQPSIEGVPLLRELTDDPDKRDILDYMASYTAFGVAFAGPPGLPPRRLEALRRAFDAALKDPELKVELDRGGYAYSPETGEFLQQLANKFSSATPELVARVKVALEEQSNQ